MKTKVDFLANKNSGKEKDQGKYIVDQNTGQRVKFESSVEASRSQSNRLLTSKERRIKRFNKNIMAKRAEKTKEAIQLEYNKKIEELKAYQEAKIMQLKTE